MAECASGVVRTAVGLHLSFVADDTPPAAGRCGVSLLPGRLAARRHKARLLIRGGCGRHRCRRHRRVGTIWPHVADTSSRTSSCRWRILQTRCGGLGLETDMLAACSRTTVGCRNGEHLLLGLAASALIWSQSDIIRLVQHRTVQPNPASLLLHADVQTKVTFGVANGTRTGCARSAPVLWASLQSCHPRLNLPQHMRR